MNKEELQSVLNRSADSIREKLIPTMTNVMMDAYKLGFETGVKVGAEMMTDKALEYLIREANNGSIDIHNHAEFDKRFKEYMNK